jgi:mannitol/fructose-specific phosphotransferase system IIA component (Ntr-type)
VDGSNCDLVWDYIMSHAKETEETHKKILAWIASHLAEIQTWDLQIPPREYYILEYDI